LSNGQPGFIGPAHYIRVIQQQSFDEDRRAPINVINHVRLQRLTQAVEQELAPLSLCHRDLAPVGVQLGRGQPQVAESGTCFKELTKKISDTQFTLYYK
jgi:hypothetical protein